MTKAPIGALLVTLLSVGALAGCRGEGPGSAEKSTVGAPATQTPSATVSLPAETDAPSDPDDPALDPALSEPVEDSVYPDVGDPSVDSLHYDLDLAWTPDTRTLVADARIELRSTADGDHLQLDLGEPLEVSAVTLDGVDVPFEHQGKDLVVSAPVVKDERYVVEVHYAGTPEPTPAPTTRTDFSASGWTITPDGETWTMQEPYGAFTWYPVNDQPSDKAFYDITVTVPSPWVGVANGELADQTEHDGLTTTSWHLSEPASSYVVTLATGDYARTTNTSQSGVEISYWVPSDRPGLARGLESAAAGLDWLESLLGPYPFDSLGFLLVDSVMDEYAAFESALRANAGPPAAYDPTQFGNGNVYYGPALMWHELRKRIGDDAFWTLVRDWPARKPDTNVSRDDYLAWLVDQTHVDRSFFDEWLLSPTTPPRS